MSEPMKGALVIAVGIVIATSIWVYFSPYHSCVRALTANGGYNNPAGTCAMLLRKDRP